MPARVVLEREVGVGLEKDPNQVLIELGKAVVALMLEPNSPQVQMEFFIAELQAQVFLTHNLLPLEEVQRVKQDGWEAGCYFNSMPDILAG